MYGSTGKKLLFMGGELGQWDEWRHDGQLQWELLQYAPHAALFAWMQSLNRVYLGEPALYELDCDPAGFEWIDANDADESVISFMRKAKSVRDTIVVVCNFTPVPRTNYRVGVPCEGYWREILNSDAQEHGGSGQGNLGGLEANPVPWHNRAFSLNLTLPPLGVVYLKHEGESRSL
jgi:1,4-alpha-glucan branching enzyme